MKRVVAWAGAYAALILFSVLYLLSIKWWDVVVPSRHGLGALLAAAGSGAIFWALAGALFYYLGRLDRFGRRVFAGLVGVLAVFLILFWPGLYDADSMAGIGDSASLPYNEWLGMAPIIQRAILRHLPWLGAVTGVQVVFFALASAYGCQTLKTVTKDNLAPALALVLSLLSAPLMYGLMLVSRETWLSIVTLFLAIECVLFFADPDWRSGRVVGRMLALGAVATVFRAEAFLYVLAVGAVVLARLVLAGGLWKVRADAAVRAFAPFVAIMVGARILLPIALPSWQAPGAYDISLWIEPVGVILNGDQSALDPEDVATIYGVAPARLIHDNWSGKSFNEKLWEPLRAGELQPPETDAERAKVRKAVVGIVMAEPATFLASRLREFAILDRPVSQEIAVQPTQAFIDSPRPQADLERMRAPATYNAIWPDARRAIEAAFTSSLQPMGLVQWAVSPDLILLALTMAMFRIAPGLAFAAFVVSVRAPALFVLMPAPQSKYFAPIEFALPFMLAGAAVMALQALAPQRRNLEAA